MRATLRLALVASFFLSPAVAVQAQTSYTLQSIIRLGDSAGGVPLRIAATPANTQDGSHLASEVLEVVSREAGRVTGGDGGSRN